MSALLVLLLCYFHGTLLGLLDGFLQRLRDGLSLDKLIELFKELFNATREKIDVLVTLLEEDLSDSGALALITHVDYDELVRLILEAEKLWDDLVPANIWRGKV